jgi:hypothetical protein
MPARRKPTALLEASGAFDHNPSRRRDREGEPIPEGPLGDPPAEWADGAAKGNGRYQTLIAIWHELIAQAPFGVLSCMDRMHVEATCYLMHKIRRASAGVGKATSGDYAQLNRNLSQMGLIPSERSRVKGQAKAAEVASDWAEVAAEHGRNRDSNNDEFVN